MKEKKKTYKENVAKLIATVKEKSNKILVQNKFIAVSAHEMRNFATKYYFLLN